MTTVDALLHEQQAAGARPVLLKIDVEGYEGLVLDGARETLVEAPLVLTEYAPGASMTSGTGPAAETWECGPGRRSSPCSNYLAPTAWLQLHGKIPERSAPGSPPRTNVNSNAGYIAG